jgi:hypothetical protein
MSDLSIRAALAIASFDASFIILSVSLMNSARRPYPVRSSMLRFLCAFVALAFFAIAGSSLDFNGAESFASLRQYQASCQRVLDEFRGFWHRNVFG